MEKTYPIVLVFFMVFFSGCGDVESGRDRGKLSTPAETKITIDDEFIKNIGKMQIPLLERYLSGNSRWEIRKERGVYYAIRREKIDGVYKTTLNGFYSIDRKDGWYQTRVIVSFEEPYGFGNDRGNITRVDVAKGKNVDVIIQGPHSGSPGYSSYIIFKGNNINIEIYDQSPHLGRTFTKEAFNDVSKELRTALEHPEEIKKSGKVPIPELYAEDINNSLSFEIKDGMQPGIYLLEAWINPRKPGELYVKVFETKTGKRLSEERITPSSTRVASWSEDGKTFFPYNAEIIVYEGDWSHQYEARFELWHKSKSGKETKIVEKIRMINGWER